MSCATPLRVGKEAETMVSKFESLKEMKEFLTKELSKGVPQVTPTDLTRLLFQAINLFEEEFVTPYDLEEKVKEELEYAMDNISFEAVELKLKSPTSI